MRIYVAAAFAAVWVCAGSFFFNVAHASPGNEINYVNSAGQRVGFWKLTGSMLHAEGYADTQVVAEGHYFANMLDGVWNTYYPNGKFKSVISWKYGYRDGKSLLYYEDGTTKSECEYENGVPQGRMIIYYPDGKNWMETTWKSGSINGPAVTYYPSGKKYEEGTWVHNWWSGEYVIYKEDGTVLRKETKPVIQP